MTEIAYLLELSEGVVLTRGTLIVDESNEALSSLSDLSAGDTVVVTLVLQG